MTHIHRRSFLKGCACTALAWGAFPWLDPSKALAEGGTGIRLLILNLNGGWDGLSVLQPLTSEVLTTLTSLRPSLVQPESVLLPTDGRFGLAPQLTTFRDLFSEGSLAGICGVGYRNMSRSHAEAESVWAQGAADRTRPVSSGYLSRLGSSFGWSSLQAVSVSGPDTVLSGESFRGLQTNGLSRFRFLPDRGVTKSENEQRRDQLYLMSQSWPHAGVGAQSEVLGGLDAVNNSVDAIEAAVSGASFSVEYPTTQLGRQFQDADTLFSTSSLGTEVVYIRRTGFDTHSAQQDTLPGLLTELNDALGAFVGNMKSKGLWNRTVVVIVSEFGRTSAENGSLGTDHGGAVPVFLLGGGVRGGQLVGEVTSSELTDNGWLPMRYNIVDIYRQIFAHMNYDPSRIFESTGDAVIPALFG